MYVVSQGSLKVDSGILGPVRYGLTSHSWCRHVLYVFPPRLSVTLLQGAEWTQSPLASSEPPTKTSLDDYKTLGVRETHTFTTSYFGRFERTSGPLPQNYHYTLPYTQENTIPSVSPECLLTGDGELVPSPLYP